MKSKIICVMLAGLVGVACGCGSSGKGELPSVSSASNPGPKEDPVKESLANKTEAEKQTVRGPSNNFKVSD